MKKVYITIIILYISCSSKKEVTVNKFIEYDNIYTIEKESSISFPLDSTTSSSSFVQFFEDAHIPYLALLNKNLNTIYLYSYDGKNVVKKINFPLNGPNSTGKVEGFYFHNLDSIFIHGRGAMRIFLSDTSGIIRQEYDISSEKEDIVPSSSFSTDMPMFIKGDYLYINSWGAHKEYYNNTSYPESLILKLNINSGEVRHIHTYPESYINTGTWGIQLHFMWNDYNPKTDKAILSFPIDHQIYVLNDNDSLVSFYAGSNKIRQVKPLSSKSKYIPKSLSQEIRNLQTQPTYYSIYTDPYSKFSLRFVNLKMSEEDFDNRHPIRSKNQLHSVIILDSLFNKVGEVELNDHSYFANPSFFSKNGFHINRGKYDYEDSLVFDIFKIRKYQDD